MNTLRSVSLRALLAPLLLMSVVYADESQEPPTRQCINGVCPINPAIPQFIDEAQRICPQNIPSLMGHHRPNLQLCTPCFIAGTFTVNGSGTVISSPGCTYTVQQLGTTNYYAITFNIPFCNPISALAWGTENGIFVAGNSPAGITIFVPLVSGMNQTVEFIVLPVT